MAGPRRGKTPPAPRTEPRLPPPSPAAFRALGPYARTRLVEKACGVTLSLDVPADVFSTQRIDEGTLLLLEHLPEGAPRSVLDLGCGYGALGLPVAARFPEARVLLVDRDLLAVAASAHNARALGLANVVVQPGLGYRGLTASSDWVLCNVPARIGPLGIRSLVEGGRARGHVRIVVIRDLMPVAAALDGAKLVAQGPRHAVFAFAARPGEVPHDDAVYARDQTHFAGLALSRPHDASEDPAHFAALAVLADALPRKAPSSVLCFRAGYGALPLLAHARWPGARVVAQDRDLLDTAFLRRNALAHGAPVEVRESLFFRDGLEDGSLACVLGELSPSAGEGVALRELEDAAALLAPGGEALILASEKIEREWLRSPSRGPLRPTILLRREGSCIVRISRPRGG